MEEGNFESVKKEDQQKKPVSFIKRIINLIIGFFVGGIFSIIIMAITKKSMPVVVIVSVLIGSIIGFFSKGKGGRQR